MNKENCFCCANRIGDFAESHVRGIFYGKCALHGALVKYEHTKGFSLYISELFHNVGSYGCAKFIQQEDQR